LTVALLRKLEADVPLEIADLIAIAAASVD